MMTMTIPAALRRTAAAALPLMILGLAGCGGVGSLPVSPQQSVASRAVNPEHMVRANKLATTITVAENDYTDQNMTLEIKDYNGVTLSKSRSECASFLTLLLKQSYNLADSFFQNNFGNTTSPYAYQYHDKIAGSPQVGLAPVTGQVFSRMTRVADLQKGDVLAIRYTKTGTSTTTSSGHIMLVNGDLQAAGTDTTDSVTTNVFDIPILDVTQSPHGNGDSRKASGDTGVGTSLFRVYVDQTTGEVVAHKWSPNANDGLYRYSQTVAKNNEVRHLELGRFIAPAP